MDMFPCPRWIIPAGSLWAVDAPLGQSGRLTQCLHAHAPRASPPLWITEAPLTPNHPQTVPPAPVLLALFISRALAGGYLVECRRFELKFRLQVGRKVAPWRCRPCPGSLWARKEIRRTAANGAAMPALYESPTTLPQVPRTPFRANLSIGDVSSELVNFAEADLGFGRPFRAKRSSCYDAFALILTDNILETCDACGKPTSKLTLRPQGLVCAACAGD